MSTKVNFIENSRIVRFFSEFPNNVRQCIQSSEPAGYRWSKHAFHQSSSLMPRKQCEAESLLSKMDRKKQYPNITMRLQLPILDAAGQWIGPNFHVKRLTEPQWLKSWEDGRKNHPVAACTHYSGVHKRSDAYSSLLSKPQLLSMTWRNFKIVLPAWQSFLYGQAVPFWKPPI